VDKVGLRLPERGVVVEGGGGGVMEEVSMPKILYSSN